MKVTIEQGALLKALEHVQSVVERRNTIPILSNVVLEAQNGALLLTATDLEIEIKESIEAEVAETGATTAPAHMLYDIVNKLPAGSQVNLSKDEAATQLSLNSGSSSFVLQSLPREDFPSLTLGDMPHAFALPAGDLLRLIDKTRFAISNEDTRHYLNGIYLHIVDEDSTSMLRAVATDGHRLAQAQCPQPLGESEMPAIIVPRKTVNELQKLLKNSSGEVSAQVSETKINFSHENISLTSKLIDGKFPDYNRVIPSNNDKRLSVDAKAFVQCVDRVSAVSNERSRAVKLSLANDSLTFTVSNPESGSATDELGVGYSADSLDIGFNARYLLDITGQLDGDMAIFELADSGSPTLIRDEQDADAALAVQLGVDDLLCLIRALYSPGHTPCLDPWSVRLLCGPAWFRGWHCGGELAWRGLCRGSIPWWSVWVPFPPE